MPALSLRSRLRGSAHRTFRSLEVRNFRLFFSGQFISQVGTWLTAVTLTLLVLHRTNSGLAIGALTAAQFGPMLLLGAWTGVVVDRSDKRRLLIISQMLQMMQSFVLAALAFMHDAPLAAFYVTALAGGVLLAFDAPARRAFIVEMVPVEYTQNAVTMNSALMTSTGAVGPAVAGLLIITVGFGWCFTIDAISYIAVLIGLLMMRTSELHQPTAAVKGKHQIREGLRYVRSTQVLWLPMAMTGIVGILANNFPVVIPLFAEQTLGGSDQTFTLMYAVLSLGSVTAALFAAHRRDIDTRAMIVAALAAGSGLLLLAGAPTVAVAFPIVFIVGFNTVLFMIFGTVMVQMHADPAMRGRVLGLQAIVLIGSAPIGGPITGAICDRYGVRTGLLVGGLACFGTAAWGYLVTRNNSGRHDVAMLQAEVEQIEVA